MRALFGSGEHPDADAMITAYLARALRAGMTERQREQVTRRGDPARHPGPAVPRLPGPGPVRQPRRAAGWRSSGRRPAATRPQAEVKKVRAEEARRQRAAVAGFDLVFSPVKSAALLWALDERPQVRDAIRAAHEAALGEALDLVEEHAAFTRTGAGGIAQVATNGLIAAAFEHWDSRAGDPNLHTHVAVIVQGPGDRREVAGTGRPRAVPDDRRGVGGVQHRVRGAPDRAARRHVHRPARTPTGGREPVREITGVPFGMIELFSRRRAAIEARYAELVRDYRGRARPRPGRRRATRSPGRPTWTPARARSRPAPSPTSAPPGARN